MKLKDKAYWSSWLLLSVFLPMVLLSSMHVHPEWDSNGEPCHECLEHVVHNGHFTVLKAHVDCPLCAFQGNVYQAADQPQSCFRPIETCLTVESAIPALVEGVFIHQNTRAPPFTSCA